MNKLSAIVQVVFWGCVFLLVYVYAGYPILLGLLARLFPRNNNPKKEFWPSVSMLISAYNEGAVIRKKIENTLEIQYPKSLFDIIVISDCSTDATDAIVSEYTHLGVRLIRQNDRLGKSCGLNLAVPRARGEVVVFSDANAMYRPDAIQKLAGHFADPETGYVVGNARYVESRNDSQSSRSESLYWKLETWLKCKESDFESVVGGDGAIYAIRRQLYSPLLPTDINDFLNPLQIITRGYRGRFDSNIVCFEETADTFTQEFRRKVRIVSRALSAVRRAPGALDPLRNPRHFWLLASHKILRWFAPFFLLGMLLASLAMSAAPLYRWAAVVQIAFYVLGFVGWTMQNYPRTPRLVTLALYFCVVNLASFVACIKCLCGNLSGTWMPHRSEVPGKS